MMNPNEVRRGNLVKYDNRIFAIDTISKKFPTLDSTEFGIGVVRWHHLKGIEITPEIMENQCEFVKESEGVFATMHNLFDMDLVKVHNGYRPEIWQGDDFNSADEPQIIYLEPIEFLHELQNLWSVLAREELEINIDDKK